MVCRLHTPAQEPEHALLYAAQCPEHVAGFALLDSSTPYQFDLPDYPGFYVPRTANGFTPFVAM
jgi:pimeloyl-ACP methyl ester carboxylesterase